MLLPYRMYIYTTPTSPLPPFACWWRRPSASAQFWTRLRQEENKCDILFNVCHFFSLKYWMFNIYFQLLIWLIYPFSDNIKFKFVFLHHILQPLFCGVGSKHKRVNRNEPFKNKIVINIFAFSCWWIKIFTQTWW